MCRLNLKKKRKAEPHFFESRAGRSFTMIDICIGIAGPLVVFAFILSSLCNATRSGVLVGRGTRTLAKRWMLSLSGRRRQLWYRRRSTDGCSLSGRRWQLWYRRRSNDGCILSGRRWQRCGQPRLFRFGSTSASLSDRCCCGLFVLLWPEHRVNPSPVDSVVPKMVRLVAPPGTVGSEAMPVF